MQKRHIPLLAAPAVVALALLIGPLSGPAGYGPGEPQSAEAAPLAEVKKLLASDAEAGDVFGWNVAVSGDTAVVGAYAEAAGAGAAYVFGRNEGGAGNWGEVKKLTASNAQAGNSFGWSVAASGNTILVGAYRENAEGHNAGAAYVFGRDEGGADNWGEVKKLTASDALALDLFGFSVAVSGDTAIVGASANGSDPEAGAAYVFGRDEGGADNWGEVKKLTASDTQAQDQFGLSVTVSGDTAVVGGGGATLANAGGSLPGAAYVFGRDEGGADNWGEVKKLTASDAQPGDVFGYSVAVSGDSAVVGAPLEDAGGDGAGAAYVFGRNEGGAGNWGEVKKLTASDAQARDFFGFSVAVSGNTAVVGAHGEDTGGSFAGAAYVFGRNEGGADNWGEVKKLAASDAHSDNVFGHSVAVSGDTAVVGARQFAPGVGAGAAYVFGQPLSTTTPSPTSTFTPTPTATPTPTPTPEGQTPSPTPTSSPTPTATPVGQTPTPTGTVGGVTETPVATSTPTDAPATQVVWGDHNCKDGVNPIDSLFVLRGDAGLQTDTGVCPDMGQGIEVLSASPHIWGDVDCKDGMTPVDSLKVLRFDAGLSVSQEEGCPAMGASVTIVEG